MLKELVALSKSSKILDYSKHNDAEKVLLDKLRAVALKHERNWKTVRVELERIAWELKASRKITEKDSFQILTLLPEADLIHTYLQFTVNTTDMNSARAFVSHLVSIGSTYKTKFALIGPFLKLL
jgi:hypothetical protein